MFTQCFDVDTSLCSLSFSVDTPLVYSFIPCVWYITMFTLFQCGYTTGISTRTSCLVHHYVLWFIVDTSLVYSLIPCVWIHHYVHTQWGYITMFTLSVDTSLVYLLIPCVWIHHYVHTLCGYITGIFTHTLCVDTLLCLHSVDT